jgi:hypothetical protein
VTRARPPLWHSAADGLWLQHPLCTPTPFAGAGGGLWPGTDGGLPSHYPGHAAPGLRAPLVYGYLLVSVPARAHVGGARPCCWPLCQLGLALADTWWLMLALRLMIGLCLPGPLHGPHDLCGCLGHRRESPPVPRLVYRRHHSRRFRRPCPQWARGLGLGLAGGAGGCGRRPCWSWGSGPCACRGARRAASCG